MVWSTQTKERKMAALVEFNSEGESRQLTGQPTISVNFTRVCHLGFGDLALIGRVVPSR